MPQHRLRPTTALLARAACLMIVSLTLSACGGQTTSPRSFTPPSSKATAPASGKSTATSSVTLTWTPPTQNVDGTPLQDLAGYRVYYSQAPWGWTSNMNVPDPAVTSVKIPNLSTGTWYFMVSAYNSAGAESNRTDPVSKML